MQPQNNTFLKLYRKNRRLHEAKSADLHKQDVAQQTLKRKLAEENAYDEGLDMEIDCVARDVIAMPRPMSLVLSELKYLNDSRLVYSDLVSRGRHELTAKKEKRFCNQRRETSAYLTKRALFQLLDWQEDVHLFLESREADRERIGTMGLMLCSDMGLGKTLNVLSYMLYDNQRCFRQTGNRYNGCTLIAVPTQLIIAGWLTEIRSKWPEGSFEYYVLHSTKNRLISRVYIENCCDFIIVTYATIKASYRHYLKREAEKQQRTDVLVDEDEDEEEEEQEENDEDEEEEEDASEEVNERKGRIAEEESRAKRQRAQDHRSDLLFKTRWKRVIADESHNFVNKRTFLFRAMMALIALIKWVVTGTPIQNEGLTDICSNFDFIGVPEVVSGVSHHLSVKDIEVGEEDSDRIKDMLKVVMIRPLKSEINRLDSKMAMMPIIKTIKLIEFESLAEKVIYYMYTTYGSRNWRASLNQPYDDNQAKSVESDVTYKNTNIASILQLMMQICLGIRVVDGIVLPHGMLTMGHEDELRLKETRHREAVLEMPATSLKYGKDDNTLEYYASRLAKKTTFHYKNKSDTLLNVPDGYALQYHRNLASAPSVLPPEAHGDSFVWDPFRKDKHFDLTHSSLDREAYLAVYKELCDEEDDQDQDGERARRLMKRAKKAKDHVKQAMIAHIVARTLRRPHYSTKNRHVIKHIREEVPREDKVIVFANSICALEALERDLAASGISAIMVNGKTRDNIDRITAFKEGCPVNGPKVLLLSLKLGNAGVNITCANHIIFLHSWWNPNMIQQAIDRAHRLGQLKTVYITHLIMNNTIDLYVLNRSHDKKFISASIMSRDKQEDLATTKRIEEYAYSLYEYSLTQ